ncbi:hypothetical protein [Geminisphaera colitermitum]|uniref:hypothetical protein n=1 Tax=Geminisphaera colitermitum TaxID=1148786 RepID=UPI000158C7E1|nr:hypothetical protein [Geminisphaera colitermitum]
MTETTTGGTMEWFFYAVAFPVTLLLLASAAYALYWASRHGQLQNLERGATTIFDDKEPIGTQTDYFPGKTNQEKTSQPPPTPDTKL